MKTKRIALVFAAFAAAAFISAATPNQQSSQSHDKSTSAVSELFDKAITAIDRNYVDPSRIVPRKLFDGALEQIQRVIPEIIVKDEDDTSLAMVVGLAEKKFHYGTISTTDDLKRAMREILLFIYANYHGETPSEEIEYAAIDGALEYLDPHSNFMPPKVYNEFQIGTRGKFGGLGIVISIKDGMLTVIAPIEGTPAAAAGIRTGDRILQIDDESTVNMSLTDAVNKLRGDVGTKVTIIVEKQGRPPRKVLLTRAVINIDSVKHKLIEVAGKRIGYLKVKSFQSNTDEDVGAALKDFRKNGAKLDGLILDLRNNPGGLLNTAVDIADRFIKEGVVVSTVGARDEVLEKEVAHDNKNDEPDYPVAVLINEGSASASEIVAGALQSNDRAIVLGRRSFGKGSVQTLFELGKGTALKLTIAQYKPAGVQTIQLIGVTPDVDLQPVTVDKKAMNLIEDVMPSEEDLEQHLGNGASVGDNKGLPPSPFHVQYLKPKEKGEGDEDEKDAGAAAKEYAKEPDVDTDFAITFARDVLSKIKGSRRVLMDQMAPIVSEAEGVQGKEIELALATLGIDWSAAPLQGEPKLALTYRLKSGGNVVQHAKAGEKVELELTAANTGTGTFSRLIAVGQSELPLLSNLEFPFGKIPAGGSRSWSTTIDIPASLSMQSLSMDVSFNDAAGKPPSPTEVSIPVDEAPQPAFSFSIALPAALKGHAIPKGSPVQLTAEIQNVGDGASSAETSATISNECGEKFFIENGRMKLGVMAPKASRKAIFKFHIANDFSEKKCSLKLVVADMKRLQVLSKKFDVSTQEGTLNIAGGKRYAAPTIEMTKLPSSTKDASAEIAGSIHDMDRVKDYFIFVGDKKVAYVPNAGDSNKLDLTAKIPLEPGNNYIAIGARDELDLLGRKMIVIERTGAERKKDKKLRAKIFWPNPGQ